MSSTESEKLLSADAPTSVPSSILVAKDITVKQPVQFKNDNVPEETVKHFNNEYRLTKTGMGMTLLERVEKLESQMETQNYRHCLATKELSAQRKRIHEYSETVKEDMKAAKIITDNMNKVMFQK